ncbi:hypothetical protein CSUI_006567 [Cystoisospora suis]|uniref:Uncharacterized protein n=1 Tax=Cystoisospora suis TaxID=483139 RepID=A0A2C6KTK6_9APIC|nr:hypothetical protein CSUI_006567 [Cystoisospora suis]
MEKQLLQQQIATLQGELQTFAQTAEANRQLMDELEQLQREKGSLQQSQAAQTQLMEELRSLQERCVQTAAVCSEIELTLLADRQSHLLHELGRSKRLQEHAERDYLFLLSQMEGFTEQIALRQTRESTPHLSSSSLPYSSSYQMKNGLPPSHENSASSSSSTDGAGRVALAVVSSSSSIETG